jgi:hypothetical protein
MRVLTARGFYTQFGKVTKELIEDKVIFVVNETYKDRCFLMINPDMLLSEDITVLEFIKSLQEPILNAKKALKEKVSLKYKRIREKR